MAEKIKKTPNIEVWADSKFITELYLWAKDMEPAQWAYDEDTGEVDQSLKREPILPG
ncbi:hypothetical protein NC796_12460 [Aliifodinibius sp. S!AR15-10]|uniref:hypothetical protein n=1 Tax=Aliifodinibius sp. S!AR15-10 TaxID=2950437 RepID=UPI00285A266E|nr:hypothetical protein [Aliifodinibius sp. S!AR15-10]MDR8391962.1 hypothetical protein [Aliifodinibius sp. S!AR15-10]